MSEANNHSHDAGGHLRSLYVVYIVLMVLLVLTVLVAEVRALHLPGYLNIIIAMIIAVVKATLVVLIFMHVMHSGKLVWVYAGAAFVWLGILLALTFGDYVTRDTLTRVQQFPAD